MAQQPASASLSSEAFQLSLWWAGNTLKGLGLKAHRSKRVREYLDSTDGDVQMAFLPPYSPDLNPVEFLWAWLKRHALANFCPDNLGQLKAAVRNKLKSAQQRPLNHLRLLGSSWPVVMSRFKEGSIK